MLNLKIITGSTRPGRKGPAVAEWFADIARQQGTYNVEVLDLAVINLPFMDEARHPRLKQYEHQHTKDWSAKIDEADAYVMVTPEYNFGFPAPLKNALDYLYWEWANKPMGIVSYGGLSAGTRATQMLKQVVTAQKMMPMAESVNIPFFTNHINDHGEFTGTEMLNKSAVDMLHELHRWAVALKGMRG